MKKTKPPRRKRSHKSSKADKRGRFRFSSTTGHPLPLQTIRQRLIGIWQSLTWPVCVKILKSNIAVTIALALLLIDPIRDLVGVGGILASIAVEFVHPTKSYGSLAEDALIGSVMCCIAASWSILGTYLASLVRDRNSTVIAQPDVCAILACFLVIGCFFLSFFRVKVEQANVGGMLSGSIMVISLTSAVTHTEFSAAPTLRLLVPTLVGFALLFAVFFLVFPENSTRVFVQQLIKVCESFDHITECQVAAFLNIQKVPGQSNKLDATLANIQQTVDSLTTILIEKKRMVRREVSYNTIAPTDVSEMTSLIKKLRIPLQGLGLSRAMEENMRKVEKEVLGSENLNKMQERDEDATIRVVGNPFGINRPRSYYGGTDYDDDDEDTVEAVFATDEESASASPTTVNSSACSLASDKSASEQSRRRKIKWEDSVKIITYWREDYDEVLDTVKPTYIALTEACSSAIKESVKRLRRLQNLDPRYQNKPFFYKHYYKWKVGAETEKNEKLQFDYHRMADPSIPLYEAMKQFHEHRLVGLNRLYTKSGVPHRILFLLLTFQFNLHSYAEHVYTLSSLIYELDQSRTERRFWMPHIALRKWLFEGYSNEESFEFDTPGAIAETTKPASLQRSYSRRTTLMAQTVNSQPMADIEGQHVLYKLNTPHRGHVCTPAEYHGQHRQYHTDETDMNVSMQNDSVPLDYHDPDVAYPSTKTQRFFYYIYIFCMKHMYTADTAFAFRASIVVAFLTLPSFLEQSYSWFNEARGQWAAVVALIWMGPSVGSNFFGTMTRTVGTFIGAIQSIIIWEISRGSVPGIIVVSFFFNLPWWMVYIHGKFWKATGLFSLITTSLIVGYTYAYQPHDVPVSVFVITWERTVDVLVGVVAALIISIFPYPRTGRVLLRQRIAQTLNDIVVLYSSFLVLVFKNLEEDAPTRTANRKMFRKFAYTIRRQIKGERVLLEQSRFEPALRGIFPEEKYLYILQVLDNIQNLMVEMEFSYGQLSHSWRAMITKDTWKERKILVSSYLTTLHLGSNALTSKAPLPPYVIRPTKARRELTNKARRSPLLAKRHLGDREYTYFSAYVMNSEQLAVEIELLMSTIRDLVGPDSVCVWLNYKH